MPRGRKKEPEVGETVAVEKEKTSTTVDGSITTTSATTKDQTERKSDVVMEKAKSAEKDNAPTILLSWISPSGTRMTRTYTCADIRINEDKTETIQKSGRKTTISISIEAQVLEKS